MPFTVAHASFALALRRTSFPIAAVAIAAMTPDAAVFFPEWVSYQVTHSSAGLLLVDLPLAIAITLAWWWVVRPALAGLAPRLIRRRLPHAWFRPLRPPRSLVAWGWLLVGAAIGAVSHVVWDSFTHEGGWMVARIPALQGALLGVPVFKLAQYGSTLVGTALVVVALTVALRRSPVAEPPSGPSQRLRVAFWIAAGSVVVLAAAAGLALGLVLAAPVPDLVVGTVILAGRASLLMCVLGFVVIVVWSRTRSARDRGPEPELEPASEV